MRCSLLPSSTHSTQTIRLASELDVGCAPQCSTQRKADGAAVNNENSECPEAIKSLRSLSAHVDESPPVSQEHRRASGSSAGRRLQEPRSHLCGFPRPTRHVCMAFLCGLGSALARGWRTSYQNRIASYGLSERSKGVRGTLRQTQESVLHRR